MKIYLFIYFKIYLFIIEWRCSQVKCTLRKSTLQNKKKTKFIKNTLPKNVLIGKINLSRIYFLRMNKNEK